MKTNHAFLFMMLFVLILPGNGCKQEQTQVTTKPELLIYCGMTMAQPIRLLADQLEKQEHCTVKMIINGSGNLYLSLTTNRVGDLYLPGSASYIEKSRQEGLVSRTVKIGINKSALIVQKGNPLGITGLRDLINPDYRTVLADHNSASIGKETRRILTTVGIYEQALDNVILLTTDSKGLTRAIKNNTADLILNWRATAYWQENKASLDVLPLSDKIAPPHTLFLGLLTFSKHAELAGKFMDLAAGPEGKVLFTTYGFGQ